MVLRNRIALISGAGSGLGRAIARAYAGAGAMVFLLGRHQEALEESYDLIVKQNGRGCIVPLDLEKDLHRVPEVAKGIYDRHGRLDILVNNAGLLGSLAPLEGYDPVQWEAVFRVNVTAPFFLTQGMLPLLKNSPAAAVINVVSGVGRHGRPFWGAYAASKAALINLTQTWAGELAPSTIRINAVDPGPTATAMRARAYPGESPLTLPTAEEITPVFLYLASDGARHLQGAYLKGRDWRQWLPGKKP